MVRFVPLVVLVTVLAACGSSTVTPVDPTGPEVPDRPSVTTTEPHPTDTADAARCAPLVTTWEHQLKVTKDAQDWADKVDDPTVKKAAQDTARRNQEIADSMRVTLVRLGCPLP
ncbi:MAG: hypothetical protein QG622_2964 [Actinomycetota bacterium]|nr:hypothetical protein [Actinomycetota bacterium]